MKKAAGLSAIALILLAVGATAVVAQDEPQTIVVAGKVVARVRDRGEYSSAMERAQRINSHIVECISKKEVGEPKMALKTEGGAPAIYCATTMLMKVYPGDAKPNNMTPKQLAKVWLSNFERELPNVEPMPDRIKRLGPNAFEKLPPREKPAETVAEAPAVVASGGAPAAAGNDPATPAAPQPKQAPAPLKRGVAQLVVLDTFSMIRRLDDSEYEKKKDQWADNLISRLRPFIRSEIMATSPAPVLAPNAATSAASTERLPLLAPAPSPTPTKATGEKPAATETVEKPTPKTVTEEKPTPAVPKPAVEEKPAAPAPGEKAIPIPAANAPAVPIMPGGSENKVPQKMRIRRKMDAAKQPYFDLKAAGDPKAEQVGELLKGARAKLYSKDFEQSEELMDAALKLLGVVVQ